MIPYFLFLIIVLIFFYKKNPIGILSTMIIFAVLRYDTGWDYASYIKTIAASIKSDAERLSWFWNELFRFSADIKFPHFAIAVTSTLTYLTVYHALKILRLNKTQICQALLVYILWYSLYLGSFSVIRQSLSVAFGLLMFAYIQKKSYIKSIISLIIAIHLHPSALVLILVYPVYFLRNRINLKLILIVSAGITFSLLLITKLIESIPILKIYLGYLSWNTNTGGLMVLIDMFLTAYLIFSFYRLRHIPVIGMQCYFLSIITFLGRSMAFLLGITSVLSRIFDYFLIFMIFIIFPSIKIFKDNTKIANIVTLFMVLFFIVYLQISKGGTDLASSGYVPYKFIL